MLSLNVLQSVNTLQLSRGQVALVSSEDYKFLSQRKWSASWHKRTSTFYAVGPSGERFSNGKMRMCSMHRVLAELIQGAIPNGIEVDHKSRDTLDNCRDNLRIATKGQNRRNAKKKSWRGEVSSQYKGVNWHKHTKRWRATISIGRKQFHLGTFDLEVEAAKAYNRAAKEKFGEFARVNKGID